MRRALAVGATALLATLVLAGCFDGTVRNPPAAGGVGAAGGAGGASAGGGSGRESPSITRTGGAEPISVAAVGDVALGITPTVPADVAEFLAPIAPELRGDVVFGNLETALTDSSEDVKCGPPPETEEDEEPEPRTCFAFRAPPESAAGLAEAGFNAMSLANNHSFDFGEAGQGETVEALNRSGIEPVGVPGRIAILEAGGSTVALLGFAPYGYAPSLTDVEGAVALVRRAAERADLVFVAIHAGAEGSDAAHVSGETEIYLGEDRGNPQAFAHAVIEAGADLVLGSGPHVLRGMELHRDRLIAYSLGNFSGYYNFGTEGPTGRTVVLHATLGPDGSFRSGRLAPVALVDAGQPVPDPGGAAIEEVATLSAEDFGEAAVKVSPDGRISAR